jgi:hypothetical protein
MNIFLLHEEYTTSARLHPRKLLPKMLLEHTQMLCTSARVLNPDLNYSWLYKSVHKKHPCNTWIRESKQNYLELLDRTYAMYIEHRRRGGNKHKSMSDNRLIKLYELSQYLNFPQYEKTLYHNAFNPISGLEKYSYKNGYTCSYKESYELYRLYILTKPYITLKEKIEVIKYCE